MLLTKTFQWNLKEISIQKQDKRERDRHTEITSVCILSMAMRLVALQNPSSTVFPVPTRRHLSLRGCKLDQYHPLHILLRSHKVFLHPSSPTTLLKAPQLTVCKAQDENRHNQVSMFL